MKIILSNIIEIQEPTKDIKDFVKESLTYKNPTYAKSQKMGYWVGGIPKEIKLYNEYNGNLYVPIGFFNKLFEKYPYPSHYLDCTVKKEINITSDIKLRDYQELAIPSVLKYKTGILNLPVGLGKTETALECINRTKQKTLWITHTGDLLLQSKERCESKMKCTTSTISQGKCDTKGDVVFSTVQTLIKAIEERKIPQNEFGMVIVDECFPKGTKINTPNGYKNIEDIKIGDKVLSYNHDKNCVEIKEVDYLFNKETDELCIITLENGDIICCTRNHPIYTNKGYVRADSIESGDVLYKIDDNCNMNSIMVSDISFEDKQNGVTVYNIGVKDNHNYFVSDKLVHNCHHISANPNSIQMFRSCIDYFASTYKIGLTATVHRADGLEKCITSLIGDVIYKIEKQDNEYCCIYEDKTLLKFPIAQFQVPACIHAIETNYTIWDKDVYDANGGTLMYAKLISDLAMNEDRNKLLLDTIKNTDGYTIVLSDRVDQLKLLCSQIEDGVQIDGGTPKKKRIQALKDVEDGKIRVLFASYNLAKEGLSINRLSNLVMASPVKDFAIVSQSIGRIQRPYGDKKLAHVYDLVDDVSMLIKFYRKRRTTYKKNNWEIKNIYLTD